MAQYKGAAKEGARAMALLKRREKQKEEMEALKKKIEEVPLLTYMLFLLSVHGQRSSADSQ